jgi:elongation factor Ts
MSIELIKQMRDATGLSVMQCKKALEEADGDMEKAMMLLKKKSSDVAAKKADRATSTGRVAVQTDNGKTAMITLLCETDFVAKNEDFIALADTLATHALEHGKETTLKKSGDVISPVIQKIGENIQLGTVEVVEAPVCGSYVHNGSIGVVVCLDGSDDALAKDIAMHISAMNPSYVAKDDIPEETVAKAKETFAGEVDTSKPADIQEKILQGKIDSYFKEQTLMEQPFIKDPSKTIGQLLSEKGANLVTFISQKI